MSAEEWLEEARARWPRMAIGVSQLGEHLARIGRAAPAFPLDTCLAAACAAGDPAALEAFDEELVARLPDVLRRIDPSAAFAHEICQQVRVRLFVRDGEGPPRIALYTGEVPLFAWLRVVAVRLALNARRGPATPGREREIDEERETAHFGAGDPEAEYLRAHYREPFARAFEAALGALPKDDRTVLRLHYVDGVNIDGIGRIFGVHRATVARWLVRIRGDVLARAKELLAAQLGAEIDEAGSVVGALADEIDVTLSRVLASSRGR